MLLILLAHTGTVVILHIGTTPASTTISAVTIVAASAAATTSTSINKHYCHNTAAHTTAPLGAAASLPWWWLVLLVAVYAATSTATPLLLLVLVLRLLLQLLLLFFAWFRHVSCHNSLSKPILQGVLEGGQCHGRQMKCWMDNIKEWTSLPMPELLTRAFCRKGWKRISAESSFMFPQQPDRSRD